MKKSYFLIALGFVIALCSAAKQPIKFCCSDDRNLPFNYWSLEVGDTVEWKGLFEQYPLRSTLVPEGAETWAVSSGFVFRYVLKIPGEYNYACDNERASHLSGGFTVILPETGPVTLHTFDLPLSNDDDSLVNPGAPYGKL